MPPKHMKNSQQCKGEQTGINKYLLRSKQGDKADMASPNQTTTEKSNMAAPSDNDTACEMKQTEATSKEESVSNSDLKELIIQTTAKLSSRIDGLHTKIENTKTFLEQKIDNISTKYEAIETTVTENKTRLDSIEKSMPKPNEIPEMKQQLDNFKTQLRDYQATLEFEGKRMDDLEKKITDSDNTALQENVKSLAEGMDYQEWRSRRYNLLMYGLPETENENVYDVVTKFITDDCKLDSDKVKKLGIANCHRIPKNPNSDPTYKPNAPNAVIVKFLTMYDRNLILSVARNLPKGKTVRTDLPQKLKTKRAELARIAYKLRKDENKQTAIRETPKAVWLEYRSTKSDYWLKYSGPKPKENS